MSDDERNAGTGADNGAATSGPAGMRGTPDSTDTGRTIRSTNPNLNTDPNSNLDQDQPSASPRLGDDDRARMDTGHGKTGLDGADEAVGGHDQHGRDHAGGKQER